MAVETMASMAPPVSPSMTAVALSRFRAKSDPRSTLAGMISEPTIARRPVSVKRMSHIAMILDIGMRCPRSRLAPLNASGKFAIKIATRNEKVTEPSFVMKPSMRASGIPSNIIPSHMDSATFEALWPTSPVSSSATVDALRKEANAAMGGSRLTLLAERPSSRLRPEPISASYLRACSAARASADGLANPSSHRFSARYNTAPTIALMICSKLFVKCSLQLLPQPAGSWGRDQVEASRRKSDSP
mmetsp:Transcript_49035/g.109986  ORF Transcript_49035/g.109986 Transcript_49035/m.109986 type:complete len:245 (-) Transcript_49035:203-937(-)